MKVKRIFQTIGILAVLFGIGVLINTPSNILGAVIGLGKIAYPVSIIFGIFFLICGTILLLIERKR